MDVSVAERTLPHDLTAERSVLGAILLHNDAYATVSGIVGASDFFRDAHRRIYAGLDRLLEWASGSADYVTLRDELEKRGDLDEVGGPAYITALVDGVPRSTNVKHYAEIVKEKSRLRGLIYASNKILSQAYAAEDSAAKILIAADRALIDLQGEHGPSRMLPLTATSMALVDNMDWRVNHRGEVTGVPTGFAQIDAMTMGWQAGDLIVIAARPSVGKTTLAVNSAVAAAQAGKHVAIFSLEMRRQQLEYRMVSGLSGVPLQRLLGGSLMSVDWPKVTAAMETMRGLHIDIDDRSGQTAWDVRTACRRLKSESGLDLVVIDYVQLMQGSLDRKGSTRNDEVTDISRRLKALGDEVSCPVLLLSQLSRANEKRNDPRPKLSDLRESGALEQDADICLFLHRKNHRDGGLTHAILEKQRNGSTGTVSLSLDRDIVQFTDAPDLVEPPPAPRKEKKRTGED